MYSYYVFRSTLPRYPKFATDDSIVQYKENDIPSTIFLIMCNTKRKRLVEKSSTN